MGFSNCERLQPLFQLTPSIISKIYPMQTLEDQLSALSAILTDSQQLSEKLQPFLAQIEQLNIELTFRFVGELAKNLSKGRQPVVRVNSLRAACKLLAVANYPSLLLAEIYLVPCLQSVVSYLIAKPDFRYFATFFQDEGYSPRIPFLQNLSYNFLITSCQFIQLGAMIKPLKIYEGRQYSDASSFKREAEKLSKGGERRESCLTHYKISELQSLRQNYVHSLSRWNEYEDQLLFFYIENLDHYLSNPSKPKDFGISFIDTLKYGEPTITSEIIARLAETIAHSQSFQARLRALRLFDNFILWGDIQALLVANYSEHIQLVVQHIWNLDGHKNLDAGRKMYPDIPGQASEKYQFYIFFLRCLQTWSECYPSNEYFSDNISVQSQSAIYKLYRLLKDKKRFVFPSNLAISKYERESHKNMGQKLIRNQMILSDINGQSECNQDQVLKKTLREVEEYYEVNKQFLLKILNGKENELQYNMKQLFQFKDKFQTYVETIDADHQSDQAIDTLIENGLELIDLINAVQTPYLEFLKDDFTYSQFKRIVTNICFEYFAPQKKEAKFKEILSERLKIKKIELKSLIKFQKSIPLWNELQDIFNSFNLKELRSKYRQRLDKLHSSNRNSESQSSLSLEIYTKTKFSKESREERMKYKALNQTYKDPLLSISHQEPNHNADHSCSSKNKVKNDENNQAVLQQSKYLKKNDQVSTSSNETQHKGNPQNTLKSSNSSKNGKANQPASLAEDYNLNINRPCEYYLIPFEQNSQYFAYLDDQRFKFSYVYSHITIFSSSYLTVERVVTHISEANKIKVKVDIMLQPSKPLFKVCYQFENQECIDIEDRSDKLPEMMEPNVRYCLQIIGTMKKIPLKLPMLTLSMNSYHIFQYTLPFTINFFLPSCPEQKQVLQSYNALIRSNYKCFYSRPLKRSETLFLDNNTNRILAYFPHSIRMASTTQDIYLWQVKDKSSIFFVMLEFEKEKTNDFVVKICSSTAYDSSYHSLFGFILNCLAHILAHSSQT